jgi:hypothetical protein
LPGTALPCRLTTALVSSAVIVVLAIGLVLR